MSKKHKQQKTLLMHGNKAEIHHNPDPENAYFNEALTNMEYWKPLGAAPEDEVIRKREWNQENML